MTVCSVTLPSLNYPRQLALMAAMTNSYLVLHARPVGHKATVQASTAELLMPKPSLRVSRIREGNFVYSLINFADVRTGGGYGLMWTKTDKGEGGSIFAIFLRTSFMDDP